MKQKPLPEWERFLYGKYLSAWGEAWISFVVQLVRLVTGVAGEIHAKALKDVVVNLRENNSGMCFAVLEQGQLLHGDGGFLVSGGADGERQQHLVRVEARVVVAQIIALQRLNGLDDVRGNQVHALVNAAESLERIQQQCGGRAEQIARFAGDDLAIGQLQRSGRRAGRFSTGTGSAEDGAVSSDRPDFCSSSSSLSISSCVP